MSNEIRKRWMEAARHDANAVLMYKNNDPEMLKTLAVHIVNLLTMLNEGSPNNKMDDASGLDRDDEVGKEHRDQYRKEI